MLDLGSLDGVADQTERSWEAIRVISSSKVRPTNT